MKSFQKTGRYQLKNRQNLGEKASDLLPAKGILQQGLSPIKKHETSEEMLVSGTI
jgi:hypothetical protein